MCTKSIISEMENHLFLGRTENWGIIHHHSHLLQRPQQIKTSKEYKHVVPWSAKALNSGNIMFVVLLLTF